MALEDRRPQIVCPENGLIFGSRFFLKMSPKLIHNRLSERFVTLGVILCVGVFYIVLETFCTVMEAFADTLGRRFSHSR